MGLMAAAGVVHQGPQQGLSPWHYLPSLVWAGHSNATECAGDITEIFVAPRSTGVCHSDMQCPRVNIACAPTRGASPSIHDAVVHTVPHMETFFRFVWWQSELITVGVIPWLVKTLKEVTWTKIVFHMLAKQRVPSKPMCTASPAFSASGLVSGGGPL